MRLPRASAGDVKHPQAALGAARLGCMGSRATCVRIGLCAQPIVTSCRPRADGWSRVPRPPGPRPVAGVRCAHSLALRARSVPSASHSAALPGLLSREDGSYSGVRLRAGAGTTTDAAPSAAMLCSQVHTRRRPQMHRVHAIPTFSRIQCIQRAAPAPILRVLGHSTTTDAAPSAARLAGARRRPRFRGLDWGRGVGSACIRVPRDFEGAGTFRYNGSAELRSRASRQPPFSAISSSRHFQYSAARDAGIMKSRTKRLAHRVMCTASAGLALKNSAADSACSSE